MITEQQSINPQDRIAGIGIGIRSATPVSSSKKVTTMMMMMQKFRDLARVVRPLGARVDMKDRCTESESRNSYLGHRITADCAASQGLTSE